MSGDPLVLAFETGGTKLVAGVAETDGSILRTASVRRGEKDRAPVSFRRIVEAAEGILVDREFAGRKLHSIGFGFGGTVRRSTNSPHLCLHEDGWDEVEVVDELEGRFGVPVFVENDCKLAALAEAHFGAGVGARSLFYVTLGTGVGGGYVQGGRILACGDLGEAEIGHVVVDPDGPECCCGNRGCVEALCSGPGLVKLCALLARLDPRDWQSSCLAQAASLDHVTSERIVNCWEEGDSFATRIIEHSAAKLATALATTVNLLVPERIVIGGGLGTSSPRLLDLLRRYTAPLVVPYFRDSFSIVGSRLRESVVTQGAAVLAAQQMRDARSLIR